MTTSNIYIFRHGETEWNKIGRCLGNEHDIPLNDTGTEQAKKMALIMRAKRIDRVYTSPLLRASQTAEIMNKFHQAPIEVVPALVEVAYGDAGGMMKKEALEKYLSVFADWFAEDFEGSKDCGFPNGETKGAFNKRIRECILSISAQSIGKDVAISTHSGVIWNFFKYEMSVDIKKLEYCEVHLLQRKGQGFEYLGVVA